MRGVGVGIGCNDKDSWQIRPDMSRLERSLQFHKASHSEVEIGHQGTQLCDHFMIIMQTQATMCLDCQMTLRQMVSALRSAAKKSIILSANMPVETTIFQTSTKQSRINRVEINLQ